MQTFAGGGAPNPRSKAIEDRYSPGSEAWIAAE